MRQLVRITGAKAQETKWFSRLCNALAGHSVHTRSGGQSASIFIVKGSNRVWNTLYRLFLVYSCALSRHIDPVYGFTT